MTGGGVRAAGLGAAGGFGATDGGGAASWVAGWALGIAIGFDGRVPTDPLASATSISGAVAGPWLTPAAGRASSGPV